VIAEDSRESFAELDHHQPIVGRCALEAGPSGSRHDLAAVGHALHTEIMPA